MLVATVGVLHLDVDTSTNSILDRHGEGWKTYQESLARFGGDEMITVALHAASPYAPELLEADRALSNQLGAIPGVRRVDSLATVPLVRAAPDGSLDLSSPLEADAKTIGSAAWVADVRADRLAPELLVSADGRTVALNVYLDEAAVANPEPVVAAVRQAAGKRAAWVSGVPTFRVDANTAVGRETLRFVPATLAMIGLLLWLIFADFRALAVSLTTASVGTWVVMGLMGSLGIPLSMSTMVLPTILLALGCTYVMHLLTASLRRQEAGSLAQALDPTAMPIALSGLTTSAGFGAMSLVDIEAIRQVGILGAVGVLVMLGTTLTLAPALLGSAALGPPPPWIETFRRRGARLVHAASTRRPRLVVAIWVLGILVVGTGALLLRVDTDVTRWFDRGTPVREDYESIRRELAGITPMNVVVDSVDGSAISDPELLASIDALASFIRRQPRVGKVVSVADPLRQLNGGFLGDPSQPLPDDPALAEQYLLLLDGVPQLPDFITADHQQASLAIRLDRNGARYLLDLARRIQDWWAAHGSPHAQIRPTGIMLQFARSTDEIAWGQIRGLAGALLAIGAILLAALRRPGLTALALLPNALPVLLAFGVMGLLGIPLDASTVFVGSLALGIAVDDTVHLISEVHRREAQGDSLAKALEGALYRVLPALCFTTVVIVLGFAVMGASSLEVIRNLGLVTGGILIVCLAADLNLLPAALSLQSRPR